MSEIGEIAAFYAARLDEEEAAAKAALEEISAWGGTWTALTDDIWKRASIDADAICDHMERHDPARALRKVAIGRRLILRYQAAVACADGDYDPVLSAICIQLWDEVSAWNDHPDYKELWAKAGKPAGAAAFSPWQPFPSSL